MVKRVLFMTLILAGTLSSIAIAEATAAGTGYSRYDGTINYFTNDEQYWRATKNVPIPTYSPRVSAHAILGYGTLGFGLAAMVTGILDHRDRDRGRKPPRAQQLIHAISSYGTAGLAIGACTSGFIQYGNVFRPDSWTPKHHAHVILGLVSTAGFIGSIVSAKADGRHARNASKRKGQYVHHTYVAASSGAVMMVSIVVMQF